MRYEGITVSNVGSYVLNWAIYATVLVGAYAAAFHLKTLRTLARENGGNSMLDVVLALLGMPDVAVVALLGGAVSAGVATGVFFDYPKPNVLDLIGPGDPSGTIRVITLIYVGFRVLFWAGGGAFIGAVLYLQQFHSDVLAGESIPPVAFANALGAHPDAGLGLLIGGVAGAVFGALRRPTPPSTGDGGE